MSKKFYKEIYLGDISNMWEEWGEECKKNGTTRSSEIRNLISKQLNKKLYIIIALIVASSVIYITLQKDATAIFAAPSAEAIGKY